MERRPARHARMHIFTRIGVFRLLGTTFGTTAWHELSLISGRKHQSDQCDGEGDDSTAKVQESARSTRNRLNSILEWRLDRRRYSQTEKTQNK